MRDAFIRALKWFGVVIFLIGGIGLLHWGDSADSIRPILPAILCLGMAYILGTAFKDLRRRVLLISMIFVTAMAFASQYVDTVVYVVTGTQMYVNFFYGWTALTFVAGVPFMTYVFYKYGD